MNFSSRAATPWLLVVALFVDRLVLGCLWSYCSVDSGTVVVDVLVVLGGSRKFAFVVAWGTGDQSVRSLLLLFL